MGKTPDKGTHSHHEDDDDEYRLVPASEPASKPHVIHSLEELQEASQADEPKAKKHKTLVWEPEPVNKWKMPAAIMAIVCVAAIAAIVYFVWLRH